MQLSTTSNFAAPSIAPNLARVVIEGSRGSASIPQAISEETNATYRMGVRSSMHVLQNGIMSVIGGQVSGQEAGRVGIETVILDDGRVRISQTALLPWRMICALRITGSNGVRAVGTGWLIGPRTLVTAGHCVHHPDLGGWAARIEVSAGRETVRSSRTRLSPARASLPCKSGPLVTCRNWTMVASTSTLLSANARDGSRCSRCPTPSCETGLLRLPATRQIADRAPSCIATHRKCCASILSVSTTMSIPLEVRAARRLGWNRGELPQSWSASMLTA